MTPTLPEILRLHALWLADDDNGVRADLSGSNLSGADLSGADLSHADLGQANLSGANLRGANLRDAHLSDAHLFGADLSDAILDVDLRSPGLAARVAAQIQVNPDTYDQMNWHSDCGTRHCAAGWCCVLADVPKEIEERLGTKHAALLALGLPLGTDAPFEGYHNPLPWLRKLAESEGT